MGEPNPRGPFSLADDEIAGVRAAFEDAGFTEDAVAAACGVASVADLPRAAPEQVWRMTADERPLSTLIRLFVVGLPCGEALARRATGALSLERWAEGGLLRPRGAEVAAAVKMVPCDGLLVAFDRERGDAGEEEDHVMGPSESARVLASLTVRRRCADALDLGAGCGFLAFLAARHADRVVATDVNPRAVAFTRFNAALNGLDNVEALVGDRLAPVASRAFDLVVSNPPFMISPEDRIRYLSGGMKADEFCRRLAVEVPRVLREGGLFQMKCSWIETEDVDWKDGLRRWFDAAGCDVWVLRSSTTDPVTYARGWMRLGASGVPDDPARLQAWLDYYAAERVASIGGGVITVRKRGGSSAGWFRAFDGPPRIDGACGAHVDDRLRALDFLARSADDATLMGAVLCASPSVRLHQVCRATAAGWAQVEAEIRVESGLAYVEVVDAWVGELVAACDGQRRLHDAIAHAAARLDWTADEVPVETAEIVRQLVEEGFLLPAE